MTQTTDEVIDNFYRAVGTRVREARLRMGVTQASLAKQIGFTRSSIANLEAGRQRIALHLLVLIADILGTEVKSLIPDSPAPAVGDELRVLRERLSEERESTREFVDGAISGLPNMSSVGSSDA